MSIIVHTVTVTHSTGVEHAYAFTNAYSAITFAETVRKQGLKAKSGSVTVYSLEDNLVGFNSIEKTLRGVAEETAR